MTSALSAAWVSSKPCRRRLPTTSSLSSTFIWQPTVSMYSFLVMMVPLRCARCLGLFGLGFRAAQTVQFRSERADAFLGLAACFGLCPAAFLSLAARFG